jgi:CspA family cold shock protein
MVHGRVKWFNAKAGYGFATDLDKGKDVFVHHSALEVGKEQFRYLVEGEYIEMCVEEKENKLTGVKVTGIKGGKLMCETRLENMSGQVKRAESEKTTKNKYKPKSEINN